jgi:hypothetical protein
MNRLIKIDDETFEKLQNCCYGMAEYWEKHIVTNGPTLSGLENHGLSSDYTLKLDIDQVKSLQNKQKNVKIKKRKIYSVKFSDALTDLILRHKQPNKLVEIVIYIKWSRYIHDMRIYWSSDEKKLHVFDCNHGWFIIENPTRESIVEFSKKFKDYKDARTYRTRFLVPKQKEQ